MLLNKKIIKKWPTIIYRERRVESPLCIVVRGWGNYELRRNWGNYELARKKHEKISFRKSYCAKRLGLNVVFKNTFSLSHQFYFIKRKKKIKDKSQNTPKKQFRTRFGNFKNTEKIEDMWKIKFYYLKVT